MVKVVSHHDGDNSPLPVWSTYKVLGEFTNNKGITCTIAFYVLAKSEGEALRLVNGKVLAFGLMWVNQPTVIKLLDLPGAYGS